MTGGLARPRLLISTALVLFFFSGHGIVSVRAGMPCHKSRVLIAISSTFEPYLTAADALRAELIRRCPGIYIKRATIADSKHSKLSRIKRRFDPDIVICIGTDATIAAQQIFPDIPKVFSMVLDPPAELIQSPNTFGVIIDIPYLKEIELLKELDTISNTIQIHILNHGCVAEKYRSRLFKRNQISEGSHEGDMLN
jgi:ABC-type uncharacterized transport system substrate-binding protein